MKDQEYENTIIHDIRGQICPSCLLFTLREVNKKQSVLKEGKTQILIKTDNRDATSTIPDTISSMGYDSTVEKKEGYYEIRITPQQNQKLSD